MTHGAIFILRHNTQDIHRRGGISRSGAEHIPVFFILRPNT
jgi:hypothetical protein